ncbi:MAG: error-prone DNA polymerase [Deltaproteobacteria bacterium]|nr:error-prone DNA polymerase [Deltaproteobacteria bacterium]
MPRYAELHCYSSFSFRRGASHPKELVKQAHELGLTGIAITDRDGLYGSVRQHLATKGLAEGAEQKAPPALYPNAPPNRRGIAPAQTSLLSRVSPAVRAGRASHAQVRQPLKPFVDSGPATLEDLLDPANEKPKNPIPHAVYGAELTLTDGSHIVALVRDRVGWRNLSSLISTSRLAVEKGSAALPFEELVARGEGLTILSGGRFGPVDRALLGIDGLWARAGWRPKGPWGRPVGAWLLEGSGPGAREDVGVVSLEGSLREHRDRLPRLRRERADPAARRRRALETTARFRDAFGDRFFLELNEHNLPEDQWLRPLLRGISNELGVPRVATGLVHYATPSQRRMQDVMSCIRLKTNLRDAGTRLLPNGGFFLRSAQQMLTLFGDDPGAVDLAADLALEHRFSIPELPYVFPVFPVPSGHTLHSYMEELAWEGAAVRYGSRLDTDPRIRGQIRHELDVIERMGLAGYFLIVWDIARECRRRGILCQGRGSAANSCVCYCLQITAVDPIGLDLLFERFLSEARGGYPDIDVDISNSMREEVLQFVYEKYGRTHAAMVCNIITYHPRSAVRDVGKAFGLGLDQVDRIAKNLDAYIHVTERDGPYREFSEKGEVDELVKTFGAGVKGLITEDHTLMQRVFHFTKELCGHPRHIGIHSGGIVLSGVPITEACPAENATMQDRTVLQWDKDDVAHTGLVKIDLLALGMLSVVQESRRLMAQQGVSFEMHKLTYDDPRVFDMICEADTVGVFQIESRAQQNTLPRLRPRSFHDLVVEVALIRPGPIQGDMVHPYLRRRQGREEITYAHPSLRPILERTLGIPLFQEQAMKMAIATAGFSPGEADRLRKVMGFKRGTEELETLFAKMVAGMEANGFPLEVAQSIRGQLRGFAAYGFPESHAASFALIVYASAWLKRFHHGVFTAALLNCQPMGFYSAATLTSDARRHGVQILPVCINRSDWRWTVESDDVIRGGFKQLKGFGEEDGLLIEEARRDGGPFRAVEDLCERAELSRRKLETLAHAGAFDCLGVDRRQALWMVAGWRQRLPLEGPQTTSQLALPGFTPLAPAEKNLMDHTVAGFSAEDHPVSFIRDILRDRNIRSSGAVMRSKHDQWIQTAGVVIARQRPGTAKGTFFMTLEDEEGFINVIVWPQYFLKHRNMLRSVRMLAVQGRVQVSDGVVQILATRFENLLLSDDIADALGAEEHWDGLKSRDFH